MSIVEVTYAVPVVAHVDTESHEVTRVIVLDESVRLVNETPRSDAAKAATLIAESSDWPAWENGY